MNIGEVYRTKDGYFFKVVKILSKNSNENKQNKTRAQIVYVQYCTDDKFRFSIGKYFRLSKLKEIAEKLIIYNVSTTKDEA